MSTISEIDGSELKCNACWNSIVSGRCYKTCCGHLYCRPCAEKYFSNKMVCPLCDANIDGDGGAIELIADQSSDVAAIAFSYLVFHPSEGFNLIADAMSFARNQTALYGSREIWKKGRERELLNKNLIECQNRLNSIMSEVDSKNRETAELTERLAAKTLAVEAAQKKIKSLERLYAQTTGRSLSTLDSIGTAPDMGQVTPGRFGSSMNASSNMSGYSASTNANGHHSFGHSGNPLVTPTRGSNSSLSSLPSQNRRNSLPGSLFSGSLFSDRPSTAQPSFGSSDNRGTARPMSAISGNVPFPPSKSSKSGDYPHSSSGSHTGAITSTHVPPPTPSSSVVTTQSGKQMRLVLAPPSTPKLSRDMGPANSWGRK